MLEIGHYTLTYLIYLHPATMSISDVTHRFLICLDHLIEQGKVRSKRHFAMTIGYHAQGLSEMVAQRRDVPLDLIEKAVATFRFNPHYLFSGNGSFFSPTAEDDGLRLRHLTLITDQKGDERIVHVPIPAQAGYGRLLDDPVFMQDLPSFQLPDPQFKSGTYRSFEISGRSMEPSFMQNDIVIAAYVEARYWEQALKNNQIFIIVTQQEVLIKRVNNRIRAEKLIECISDNPEYEPYPIAVKDILEVWKVRMKITAHLDPSDTGINSSMITRQLMAQQKMLEDLRQQFDKSHSV